MMMLMIVAFMRMVVLMFLKPMTMIVMMLAAVEAAGHHAQHQCDR